MHVILYTCQDTNNSIGGSLWCMWYCTLVRTLTTLLNALYDACDLVYLSGHWQLYWMLSMMHVILYTCQDTNNSIEGSLWCMWYCTLVRTLTTLLKALYDACDLVHLSGQWQLYWRLSMIHVILYTCQDSDNSIEGSLWCMWYCVLVRTLTTLLKALYDACDLVHLSGH